MTIAELIDAVWGDRPPPAAVSVLRTYASRLRKVLEPERDAGEPPQVIVSAADGYRAQVPDCSLDLGVFEQRVAAAKKLRTAGEVAAAAELLHAALDGWEGTPLAGLPGPLAEAERSRLAEVRLTTLETRLDADLQLGRHTELIAELTKLAGEHPLRERLCQLLMLALYRSGRQADALAAYRRTRCTLVAELGVEPGASLRELHNRILAADASLDPSAVEKQEADTQASLVAGYRVHPAQLPADLATFTGRQAELAQTEALLPDEREHPATVVISAIGGMGGVGKTTLAVHWAHRIAHRYPDGQLYINLRGFDPTGSAVPSAEVIRSFLDALGVPLQRIPASLEAQAALYRSLLANRRVLIVLDNARDTEHVRPLLPGSPGCLVIVTSRSQLTALIANDGAYPLTLNPLTPAEAHDFLVRRVGAARVAAEPQATDELIARCARLPLALAIVAARAATHQEFPLSEVAKELHDTQGSLDAFAGGDLAADVRAVFTSSYEALSTPAARLFHLLGLHSGPDISTPAAAALAGLPLRETRGLLTELTRAHLLTEHVPGRYVLHDLLRVYAAERVAAEETTQERDRAVERLLCWYLHTAHAAYLHLTPRRRRVPLEPLPPNCHPLAFTAYDQALQWCDTERRNLVAAVHQAANSSHAGVAWRLTGTLWGFFYLRSHRRDWIDTTKTALDAARKADDRTGEAWSLGDVAAALRMMDRFDESIDHLQQAMVHLRRLGDTYGRSQALGNLGDQYLQLGRLDKAVEYIRRSLALDRALGNDWGIGIALTNLGDAYQRLDRLAEAVDCLEEALTILRAHGNHWVEGVALDSLGTAQHRLHHRDDAIERYQQALKAHRKADNRRGEGDTLHHLGDFHLEAGRLEAARASWQQALAIFEESDHPDTPKLREKLLQLGKHESNTGPHRVATDPEMSARPTGLSRP